MRSLASVLAGLTILFTAALAPDTAEARWLRAESPRFIVYSDGDEGPLRDYVQNLETFDRLLRGLHGLPLDAPPPRKLEVYLIRERDLDLVRPGSRGSIAGFYSPSSEDIFAVAVRERRQDYILLHEYVHHFMHQHFPYGYPGWLVEGYAEYFMGADIGTEWITYGDPAESRGGWLFESDQLPLRAVVTREGAARWDAEDRQSFYAQSWVLTHYFMATPERRERLYAYMRELGDGADPVEALERAADMPLAALARTLQTYIRGGMPYSRVAASLFPDVEIAVTPLPASADDLLLVNQRLRLGAEPSERADVVDLVRRRAAPHGEDPLALLALGHAELHFGDRSEGERLLQRLLVVSPGHPEALQLLASSRYAQAQETSGADSTRLLSEARDLLVRALEQAPDDYRTYYWIGLVREGATGYPTDNDIAIWSAAYDLAPQLSGIRLGAGRALIQAARSEEAIALLGPVANNPHGGDVADYAARLIALAQAGQPPEPEPDWEALASED